MSAGTADGVGCLKNTCLAMCPAPGLTWRAAETACDTWSGGATPERDRSTDENGRTLQPPAHPGGGGRGVRRTRRRLAEGRGPPGGRGAGDALPALPQQGVAGAPALRRRGRRPGDRRARAPGRTAPAARAARLAGAPAGGRPELSRVRERHEPGRRGPDGALRCGVPAAPGRPGGAAGRQRDGRNHRTGHDGRRRAPAARSPLGVGCRAEERNRSERLFETLLRGLCPSGTARILPAGRSR